MTKEKDNMVIIDGSFLLFRMFYGIMSQIRNKQGTLLNAVLGFCGAVLRYLKKFEPKYMFVVFDGESGSFRSEIEDSYKATRQQDFSCVEDDQNPFCQLPIIMDILTKLGINFCESTKGWEGDDVIASCIAKYGEVNKYIITGDCDMLQLVDEGTYVYMDRGEKSLLYDKQAVKARFGVLPTYIGDYKALVGDNSDNISGVAGIGPKTAASLITQLGGIESLIAKAEILPDKLKVKITENAGKLRQNMTLINLRTDSPLPYTLEQLRCDNLEIRSKRAIDILRLYGYVD